MVEDVSGTQPFLGVLHKQSSDEILGRSGHRAPFSRVKLELPLLYVGEEVELAAVALSSRRPGALLPAGPAEWRVAAEQDVHHDAEAPEVTTLVVLEVLLGVFYEGFNNLWCHELCRANRSEEQRSGVRTSAGVELDAGAKIKVAKFYWSESVSVDTEDILWLEVPVSNTLGVEELQGRRHVSDDVGRLLLSEIFPGLDVIEELASRNLLEYQVKSFGLLEILNQLDDVWMTLIQWNIFLMHRRQLIVQYLTMMEEINLLEDPGPAVGGHFVNDLDGVLHLSIDVDAGLDRGVSALSKHLPGEAIELMKCVGGQGGGAGSFLLLPPSSLGLFLPGGDCYGPLVFFCCKIESLMIICHSLELKASFFSPKPQYCFLLYLYLILAGID